MRRIVPMVSKECHSLLVLPSEEQERIQRHDYHFISQPRRSTGLGTQASMELLVHVIICPPLRQWELVPSFRRKKKCRFGEKLGPDRMRMNLSTYTTS